MSGDVVLVAVGAFFGAIARYGLSRRMGRNVASLLPTGTLLVNLSGSFLLGIIAGGDWGQPVYLLLGTGFMGAYTTFSTFNMENVQLAMQRQWSMLIIYAGISYTLGIALAFAGFWIGTALQG